MTNDKKDFQCSGPCNQGRDPCPTPWACEKDEPEPSALRALVEDVLMASAVVMAIFAILLIVL